MTGWNIRYKQGLRCSQSLTMEQARIETISLLDFLYPESKGYGYEAVLIDVAVQNLYDTQSVIQGLADLIKSRQRDIYEKWIYWSHIYPLPWKTKYELVKIIAENLGPDIPSSLAHCKPAQLCEHILALLQLYLKTSNFLTDHTK